MQINVSQLLREAIGATRDYFIDEVVDITSDGDSSPVKGECHLLRTQRSVLTKCSLDVELKLVCSRCLNDFRHRLTLNFEEEYFPSVDVNTGSPLPLPEEAGNFTIDEHHILDLAEATRQYSLLAVPMKPLCREKCAGICPDCGANLNRGKCNCPGRETDPRWSELSKLL